MQINRFKSMQPVTPYAPFWNVPIGFTQWEEHSKINIIKEFLLNKEQQILELEVTGDGGTGLTDDTTTTRYGKFNTFQFSNECSELTDLLNFIRLQYLEFIKQDATQYYDLEIVSWYNIIRKGQRFNYHSHGEGHNSYLSGNMHFDNYPNSGTHYKVHDQNMVIPNIEGGLTLFPSSVIHKVDEYTEDFPRVSLAFDLYVYQPPYLCSGDDAVSLPFINQEIYESIK